MINVEFELYRIINALQVTRSFLIVHSVMNNANFTKMER